MGRPHTLRNKTRNWIIAEQPVKRSRTPRMVDRQHCRYALCTNPQDTPPLLLNHVSVALG